MGGTAESAQQPSKDIFIVSESLPAGILSLLEPPIALVLTRQEHRKHVESMSWFVPCESTEH